MSTMASKRPSQSAGAHKVCVVSYGDGVYSLLFLDLDINRNSTPGFIDKEPALLIRSAVPLCFCELNSSLYMFDASLPPLEFEDPYTTWGALGESQMFRLDLDPHLWDSNSHLEIELGEPCQPVEVRTCPNMKTPKNNIQVIKTPDGRMLAFSLLLPHFRNLDFYEHRTGDLDFEIFDPESESWTELPQLHLISSTYESDLSFRLRKNDQWIDLLGTNEHGPFYQKASYDLDLGFFKIGGGTFINNTTFLIGLPIGAMFTLNINNPKEGWNHYQVKIEPPLLSEFLVVQEDLILTPSMVKRGTTSHSFSLTWHPSHVIECRSRAISVLDDTDPQNCIACVFVSGGHNSSLIPFIICDLFSIDRSLATPPTCVGTFKFDSRLMFSSFYILNVFPIMAIESLEKDEAKHPKITNFFKTRHFYNRYRFEHQVSQKESLLAIDNSEAKLKASKSGHVDTLEQKMLHQSICSWPLSALQKAASYLRLGRRPLSNLFLILGCILGFAFIVAVFTSVPQCIFIEFSFGYVRK